MSDEQMGAVLARLETLMAERRTADPAESYVAKLYARGPAKIAQKFGEEAVETVIAAMGREKGEIVSESADLLFHWLVLLAENGVTLNDVAAELARREGVSGIDERKARPKS